MNLIRIVIMALVLSFLTVYGFTAIGIFIEWFCHLEVDASQFNFTTWQEGSRGMFASAFFILSIMYAIYLYCICRM